MSDVDTLETIAHWKQKHERTEQQYIEAVAMAARATKALVDARLTIEKLRVLLDAAEAEERL